jgi:hypothetical protein
MRTKIASEQLSLLEGALRRIYTEDGEAFVYDTEIGLLIGKDLYVLNGYVSSGSAYDPEVGEYVCRNAKHKAAEFAARIAKAGSVDLRHWTKVEQMSHEQREAYNLRCEQEERLGW